MSAPDFATCAKELPFVNAVCRHYSPSTGNLCAIPPAGAVSGAFSPPVSTGPDSRSPLATGQLVGPDEHLPLSEHCSLGNPVGPTHPPYSTPECADCELPGRSRRRRSAAPRSLWQTRCLLPALWRPADGLPGRGHHPGAGSHGDAVGQGGQAGGKPTAS